MRKLLVLIPILGLVAASCGGDSGAGSCAVVADDAVQLFQTTIDELDSMTLEELGAFGEEGPPAFADLETKGLELQERAEELNCDEAEMEELLNARIGDLTADGEFGQFMIDGLEGGGFFD